MQNCEFVTLEQACRLRLPKKIENIAPGQRDADEIHQEIKPQSEKVAGRESTKGEHRWWPAQQKSPRRRARKNEAEDVD